MIRLEQLTHVFHTREREVVALDHVDLRIAQGELVAIVGPSGSGKSTLLFAAGGLTRPTSGEVHLGETKVYDLSPSERSALRLRRIGFVFQTFNLVPYLDCVENVALPALLTGRSKAEAYGAAARILERLGLSARAHHHPAQLSVGERQRVGVGRALVNDPQVLLADEPTGNLDPVNAREVMELFRELNREGQTIVMVTHDPALAERADRVVRLSAGALALDPRAPSRTVAS